jgi:hypothetical protein
MQTFAGGASHTIGVPVQAPAAQVSATVQALPSSQVASSTNAYWQTPPSHVPVSAWHAVGGLLHAPQVSTEPSPPT